MINYLCGETSCWDDRSLFDPLLSDVRLGKVVGGGGLAATEWGILLLLSYLCWVIGRGSIEVVEVLRIGSGVELRGNAGDWRIGSGRTISELDIDEGGTVKSQYIKILSGRTVKL